MMSSRGSLGLILCWCVCLPALVLAQTVERLTGDVIGSPNVLTVAQRQIIAGFAQRWAKQLADDDVLSVVEARDRLMEPLRGQPSDNFRGPYAAAVGPHLLEPLKNPRVINRLNTMIVSSVMLDHSLVPVTLQGLRDSSPAVRYWAGRTAANLGAWGKLSIAEETELLKVLSENIVKEDNRLVLQSFLIGLSHLNIPEASRTLLVSLNARVAAHVENPGLTALPEARALETMFSRIAKSLGGNQPNAQTREILRQALAVLYRYTQTTAKVMATNPPTGGDLLREYQTVLEIGDIWIPWAYERMTGSKDFPSFSQPLKTGQWNTVLLTIQDDMKRALMREPLSLKADDLKVE